MSRLSEKDFEYLNALADGELDDDTAREWRARIDSHPGMRTAYDEIVSIKRKLAGLGADAPELPALGNQDSSGTGRWAIAASIAAVLLAGAVVFWPGGETTGQPQSIAAWHDRFSGQEYVVDQGDQPLFVSFGTIADIPIPDLQAWRLYLVDHHVLDQGTPSAQAVLHYRGLRGCRLTIRYGASVQPVSAEAAPAADGNFRHWLAGSSDISIIASGMDAGRFGSIADYVELLTKASADPSGKMQIAEASGILNAPPCTQV
ncbi:anti-sigma factor family protein [Hoeflea poritis]|uniref:Anti-sigma factor n=1 Tax=Hoeflea poritis TaxID=2993659 RepID=A0ABT4VPP9_9HYPH|nr:hypothetical protein [Hoeflea poritis]MDA4846135.1 hypothetical protein [Hoeflea poritis]